MIRQRSQKCVTQSFPSSPIIDDLTDAPLRGCGVETLETSKLRAPPRHCSHSSPVHLGMNVKRGSDGTHQEALQHRTA